MQLVNKQAALSNPTQHVFVPAIGHVFVGDLPKANTSHAPLLPKKNAFDGARHILRSPQGVRVAMIWRSGNWHPANPAQGNRMAWTPAHLAAAGWML